MRCVPRALFNPGQGLYDKNYLRSYFTRVFLLGMVELARGRRRGVQERNQAFEVHHKLFPRARIVSTTTSSRERPPLRGQRDRNQPIRRLSFAPGTPCFM